MSQQAKEPVGATVYTVKVNGTSYVVEVNEGGDIESVAPPVVVPAVGGGEPVPAPLPGDITKINVKPGQMVQEGDVILIMEAMKMEAEVCAPKAGIVSDVEVSEGDKVSAGDALITIA